jgi:hypothetical protein
MDGPATVELCGKKWEQRGRRPREARGRGEEAAVEQGVSTENCTKGGGSSNSREWTVPLRQVREILKGATWAG